MGSGELDLKALGLDQNEINSIERALEGFPESVQKTLNFRLALIEYEKAFTWSEQLEPIRNADYSETVYRLGTAISGFSHAKFIVLESTTDELRGFCWDISEQDKKVILKNEGKQEWTFNEESKLVFKCFTDWSDDEITNFGKTTRALISWMAVSNSKFE